MSSLMQAARAQLAREKRLFDKPSSPAWDRLRLRSIYSQLRRFRRSRDIEAQVLARVMGADGYFSALP